VPAGDPVGSDPALERGPARHQYQQGENAVARQHPGDMGHNPGERGRLCRRHQNGPDPDADGAQGHGGEGGVRRPAQTGFVDSI
jgi:hypothetical protein